MTITLYAQPYDICATGFYFETVEEYAERAADNRNDPRGIFSAFTIVAADTAQDDSTTNCQNPNGEAARFPFQRAKCVFFADKSSRWRPILDEGLYPETPGPLPDTVTARLGHDCRPFGSFGNELQPGVTIEMCEAQYTCTKESF